ncbi:hypothetical protein DOTSEDRAFT_48303 [Dothistroma septosporum NZE10]|uniref:BZIP domain-containing protein n=1 Tax=Dothistroma septosporum (strain NZE10 / CBS 128990) TaxID=675120 RepID=M2YIQ5_DOTSN|nr:hypothetical protein DOTSEDRAFT_48303 [Dothistroma septosporum NZE10]
MEAMDYNYFASAQQPYQFMGYGDAGLLSSTGEVMGGTPSMEALDSSSFALNNFDYNLDSSLGHGSNLTTLPTALGSPRPQQISIRPNGSVDSEIALDVDHEDSGRRGSSEEQDSLTPAQSRRKAQNRAAQRAFRERKERHVRDLEAKLNLLTTTTSSLQSDNERLKLMLRRAQTENEILRATASSSPTSHHPPSLVNDPSLLCSHRPSKVSLDPRLDAVRLAERLPSADLMSPSCSSSPESDSNLLSASATWDLLQSHPLYLSGAIDIGEVCERLKKMARCDGMGPMFDEDEVRQVIEEVGSSGNDELI